MRPTQIWWLCVKFYDQKPIQGWQSKINLTWFEKMNRFEIWIFDILITWLGLWSEINRLRDSSHVFCHIALFSKTCDIYWWQSRQQLTWMLFWKGNKLYLLSCIYMGANYRVHIVSALVIFLEFWQKKLLCDKIINR